MMKEIKHYVHQLERYPEKEMKAKEIICDALEHMKEHCADTFWKTVTALHMLVYGAHFDESTAKMAVDRMENVDGTHGEHWTKEETDKLAAQYGIDQRCDFYYAMNMLYSDLSKVVGDKPTTYAEMAKALYFDDPDAPDGKLFRQWAALMLWK